MPGRFALRRNGFPKQLDLGSYRIPITRPGLCISLSKDGWIWKADKSRPGRRNPGFLTWFWKLRYPALTAGSHLGFKPRLKPGILLYTRIPAGPLLNTFPVSAFRRKVRSGRPRFFSLEPLMRAVVEGTQCVKIRSRGFTP